MSKKPDITSGITFEFHSVRVNCLVFKHSYERPTAANHPPSAHMAASKSPQTVKLTPLPLFPVTYSKYSFLSKAV